MVGITPAASGTNAVSDCAANPNATIELDKDITYSVARVALSDAIALAADWSTKCSVVNANSNADCSASSFMTPHTSALPPRAVETHPQVLASVHSTGCAPTRRRSGASGRGHAAEVVQGAAMATC